MEILTRQAHRQGMRVMLKPHTRKPREADLADAESRARWFARYEEFVAHYAAFARRVHADLLSVGCEFEWLTAYEAEWRRVIARARREYPGPLVYSPNFGKEFESIAFWDALDYIGIDNYYPLPDDYSAAQQAAKIEAVHKRFGKPVLFTEAGFSAAEGAHRAPWEDESAKALSLDEQARCYEALLREFYGKPWFSGVYWWKVGTNGYGGPANNSMTPWRKPAMDVVKRWYARAR